MSDHLPPSDQPERPVPPGWDAPAPATPQAVPGGRHRSRMWIGAAAAGLALLVGGAAAAGAARSDAPAAPAAAADGEGTGTGPDTGAGRCAPDQGRPGHRGPGARGTITAVDGATLTVETERRGTVTVATTEETRVVEMTEGSLDDIAVGDTVRVVGRPGDDGNVTARAVVDTTAAGEETEDETPPEGEGEGQERRLGMTGTVASVEGAILTVTTADGETVTVTTDDDTTFAVTTALTVADLEVGDTIGVRGAPEEGSDAVTARGIVVGEVDLGHHRGGPPPEGGPAPEDGAEDAPAPPTTN